MDWLKYIDGDPLAMITVVLVIALYLYFKRE